MLNFVTQSCSQNAQRTTEKTLCAFSVILCVLDWKYHGLFIHTVVPPPGF